MNIKKTLLLVAVLINILVLDAITLDECRKQAIEHNKEIKSVKESTSISRLEKKVAYTQFLPSFNLLGSYIHNSQLLRMKKDLGLGPLLTGLAHNQAVATDPFFQGLVSLYQQGLLPSDIDLKIGKPDQTLFSFSMTQPIFTGGKLIQNYRIANALLEVSELELNRIKSDVVYKTDDAYWRLVTLYEKKKMADLYKQGIEAHLHNVTNLYEEGVVTKNDVLKVKVYLNDAELSVKKVEDGIQLSKMALNQIMGNSLTTDIVVTDSLTDITDQGINTTPQRAEIKELEKSVEIAKSISKIQASRYLPNIVFNANLNYLRPNIFNNMEAEYGNDWTISLLANWELFHWGDREMSYSAAKHGEKMAEYKLEDSRELINLQIEQSKLEFNQSQYVVDKAKSIFEQANENLKETTDKFNEGMVTSSEVLDANTLWQKAYSELIDASAERQVSYSKLQKVLGLFENY